MPPAFRTADSVQPNRRLKFVNRTITCATVFIVTIATGFIQAQSTPAPQPGRIMVKLKPALAQQVEAEFPASMPPQEMHIRPGQSANAHVQDFIRRHLGIELSPLYPA